MTDIPNIPQRRSGDWPNNVRPFTSKEDKEAQALRAEIESLKLEVQSLSENLTHLMEMMYKNLEQEVATRARQQYPGINP